MCKLKTIEPDGLNTNTACLPSYSTMIIECFYILFLFSSGIFHRFLSLFFFHLLLFWCYGYLYDTWIPNTRPRVIIRRIVTTFGLVFDSK